MNKSWLWVLLGGVFETGWATAMKLSNEFTNLPWTVITLIFIVISAVLLNVGLKAGLPMGPCYAVWVGIGAIGSIIVGLVLCGEVLNIVGWIFLAVIITGIIGLNLITEGETPDSKENEKKSA